MIQHLLLIIKPRKKIINAINNFNPNMTKILISQKIKSLQNTDYTVVLDNGEIENIGTHDELLEKSVVYSEINSVQEKDSDFDA